MESTSDSPDPHIFQRFSPEDLARWLEQLKYFKLFRRYGGHSNDFDEVYLLFSWANTTELRRVVNHFSFNVSTPDVCVGEQRPCRKLRGWVDVAHYLGFPIGVFWCFKARPDVLQVYIRFEDNCYPARLVQETIDIALKIEPHLGPVADLLVPDSGDDKHYLTAENYGRSCE